MANKRTVAHEIFHAVLLNKLKMNDKVARAVTKKMVQALSRSKTLDKATRTELKKFIKNYDSDIQNEEKLAEIVDMIASNYTTLDASTKSVVRKWIEKVAYTLGIEIGQSEADVAKPVTAPATSPAVAPPRNTFPKSPNKAIRLPLHYSRSLRLRILHLMLYQCLL